MSADPTRTSALSEITSIFFDVRAGRAEPHDARLLLTQFCQCVEQGSISPRNPIAVLLLEHVREAFRAYLSGKRVGNRDAAEVTPGKNERGIIENEISTIEAAFGLVRKKGRPEADEGVRMQMAAAVMERRLTGMSHQDAVTEVAEDFNWVESIVGEAWRAHRISAVALVQRNRGPDNSRWTDMEMQRLHKILGNKNELLLREILGLNRCDPEE